MKTHWILLGLLILPLITGCSPTRAEAPVQTIGDVSAQMITAIRHDMDVLITSTENLKTPDSLADRLSDEYRTKLTGSVDGAIVPCDGVNFKKFLSGTFQYNGTATMPLGGLPPVRVPSAETFPINFTVYNHPALIDRWRMDPSHATEAIQINNNGDVTATTEVWVKGDGHTPIPPQSEILHYSITYRASDMKIINFSAPSWFYFAVADSEVDPSKVVSGFHRDTPELPLARDIEGYTVTDETGFAYMVASRNPNPQADALAPDPSVRQRAASITRVAVPIQVHNWRSLDRNPKLEPSIYTTNLVIVPGGLWAVLDPYIKYRNGDEMLIQGYAPNSPLLITTAIPIAPETIDKWSDKSLDSSWSSECFLTYYLLGSITSDPCPRGLVIQPERIVATARQRIYFHDTGVLDQGGGHPIISISSNEEIVADYDAQIQANLARFQASQHHAKPVSTLHWFPR